jgi:hypothetical protein
VYAFQIERVTHFSLTRQNASLCGLDVGNGIELERRQGLICLVCGRLEHATWVDEWQRRYGVLGPIMPRSITVAREDRFGTERLVA